MRTASILLIIGQAFFLIGLVEFFLTHFHRQNSVVRYIADRSLWLYLTHVPALPFLILLIRPEGWSAWVQTITLSLAVTGLSFVSYDLLLAHTPLVRLFGPGGPSPGFRPACDPDPVMPRIRPGSRIA
jgi:peptidoglycan/LPS O-acetylase OafA/YrhL